MFPRLAARLTIGYYATLTPVMRQGFPPPPHAMPSKRPLDTKHLQAYRAKRKLERTPEPAGGTPGGGGGLFVVHQHAARRLHFDLRLEMEGVLRSWAVPKGPSYDTNDKRLAVHVEDHPLEYGDFEGLIPAGNYGAGAVIVWDRGQWVPHGDPLEGLEKGKLLFELKGYKLHGMWTLVKIKKSEKDWLLIKERDAYATTEPQEMAAESVLSGLTVEELGEGGDRGERIRARLDALGATRRAVDVQVGEAHAGGDGRPAVHAQGVAVRAQARRLSRAGGADRRRLAAADPQRQRHRRRLSRGHPGDRGAAVRAAGARRRSGRARRRRPPQLSTASGPRQAEPPDRHPPRDGLDAGHLLRLRPARLRGLRSPRAAADGAEGAAAGDHPPRGRAAVPGTRRASRARCSTRRPSASSWRASSRRRRTRPTRRGGLRSG